MKTLMICIFFVLTCGARSECEPKLLKKFNMYYEGLENAIYIERLEKEPTTYRGIATTKGEAMEMAFKDIKEKRCPDLIRK